MCFKQLQIRQGLLKDQNRSLVAFDDNLKELTRVAIYQTSVDILTSVMKNDVFLQYNCFVVYRSHMNSFSSELRSFACGALVDLNEDCETELCHDFSYVPVDLCVNSRNIVHRETVKLLHAR